MMPTFPFHLQPFDLHPQVQILTMNLIHVKSQPWWFLHLFFGLHQFLVGITQSTHNGHYAAIHTFEYQHSEPFASQPQSLKLRIVEIGYGPDKRYMKNNKRRSNMSDCRMLREERHKVKFISIILGTQGSIYKCSTKALRSDIPTQIQKTVHRNCASTLSTHSTSKQTRHLKAIKDDLMATPHHPR